MDLERQAPAPAPLASVRPAGLRVDVARRRVFTQELIFPAWMETDGRIAALVYKDDAAALSPGDAASFSTGRQPRAAITVHLAADGRLPWDGSTVVMRFIAAGPAPVPGATGWVTLPETPRAALVVPSSAILNSPDGPFVLVTTADGGSPERRHVVIGKTLYAVTTVVSGLSAGDRVVVTGAFFIDAELRLRGDAPRGVGPTP
jgi:hypothetical protein